MATASSELQGNGRKRKKIDDGVPILSSKRRKETLFRKCHELTVKSDVQVSLVCIGSDGEIEAWPNLETVKAMFTKHREEQAEKNGKMKKDKFSHESESEEKEKSANDTGKLSAESLMTLLRELDSKFETLNEKIKMLSAEKATDSSSGANNSGSFMEGYDWNDLLIPTTIGSYGLPWGSSVQPNQPTQFTEEPVAVSADIDYSFINSVGHKCGCVPQNTENFALNHIWDTEMELFGYDMNRAQHWPMTGQCDIGTLQNHYLGSNWEHLLQW